MKMKQKTKPSTSVAIQPKSSKEVPEVKKHEMPVQVEKKKVIPIQTQKKNIIPSKPAPVAMPLSLTSSYDVSKLREATMSDDQRWYSKYPKTFHNIDANSFKITDTNMIATFKSKIESIIHETIASSKKVKEKLSSDEKWMNDVIRSGTLSDKIAALALKVQSNPILEIDTFEILMQFATKKEQRPAQLALEAIKDLLANNLLPDHHLRAFHNQPLQHPKLDLNTAMLMWYEDKLIDYMKRVLMALELGLKSTVDHFKKSSMMVVKDMLTSKPEQEGKLLCMLVNKLGDPSSKVSSYAVDLLNQLVSHHPAMRAVIIREVRQFISHPNLKPKIVYTGILFLSQMSMRQASSGAAVSDLAVQLVDAYVSLFQRVVMQEELKSKLLSALLVGINKAFPHLQDKQAIMGHLDSLFRLVHNSSFTTSTQALVLISYLVIGNHHNRHKNTKKPASISSGNKYDSDELTSRYYRALYTALSQDQVLTKTHNTVFLNLLYRSIKNDSVDIRAAAFIKRILLCALHSAAPVTAALLLLISEVIKTKPQLVKLLNLSSSSSSASKDNKVDAIIESTPSSQQLGSYDPSKRDPAYAFGGEVELLELSLLQHHYHPSVQAFVRALTNTSSHHHIIYDSDPTLDLSIVSFLNRFAYKNPKKKPSSSSSSSSHDDEHDKDVDDHTEAPAARKHRHASSSIIDATPVNSSKFIQADENDVDPEKKFFHKFFIDRQAMQESGRVKIKRRVNKADDDEHDDDEKDDDEDMEFDDDDGGGKAHTFDRAATSSMKKQQSYEDEIDAYADHLADELMRNIDDDADVDDISDDDDDMDDDDDDDDDDDEVDDGKDHDDDGFMDIEEDGDYDDDDSSLGGHDLDDFEDDGGEDDDMMIPSKASKKDKKKRSIPDDCDDIDDDYDLMEYGDEDMETSNHKTSSGISTKANKKSKKTDAMSDFADAADYEDEMEAILNEIKQSQSSSSSTSAPAASSSKKTKAKNTYKPKK